MTDNNVGKRALWTLGAEQLRGLKVDIDIKDPVIKQRLEEVAIKRSIATIGHVDHGKTTMTAAITSVLSLGNNNLSKFYSYDKIDKSPEEKKRGITISATTICYYQFIPVIPETIDAIDPSLLEAPRFGHKGVDYIVIRVSHVDCPGHADYIKNFITGASSIDMAILICAGDGPMTQTREHIKLIKQIGVKDVFVFISKVDIIAEAEFLDMTIEEVKDLLITNGYNADDSIFFKVSGLAALKGDTAAENTLLSAVIKTGAFSPKPMRDMDKPAYIYLDGSFNIAGRGTVVSGTVQQGTFKVGDAVILYTHRGDEFTTTITGIESFNTQLPKAAAGDNVGLLLRGIDHKLVGRGDILAVKGIVEWKTKLRAQMYLLTTAEGGRKTPITSGYRPQMYNKTTNCTATVHLIRDGQVVLTAGECLFEPGQTQDVELVLDKKRAFTFDSRVIFREGNQTIGVGMLDLGASV